MEFMDLVRAIGWLFTAAVGLWPVLTKKTLPEWIADLWSRERPVKAGSVSRTSRSIQILGAGIFVLLMVDLLDVPRWVMPSKEDATGMGAYFPGGPVVLGNQLHGKNVVLLHIWVVNDGTESGTQDWEVYLVKDGSSTKLPLLRLAADEPIKLGQSDPGTAGLVVWPTDLWNQRGSLSVQRKGGMSGYLLVERPWIDASQMEGAAFTIKFKDSMGGQHETTSVRLPQSPQ
jgi:hypothetical protein